MEYTPEDEARALLAKPLICEDSPAWSQQKNQPGTFTLECGLVDADGRGSGLHVQLVYRFSQKTKTRKFAFSVFQRSLGTPQRVYGLDLKQAPRKLINDHDMPHEHFGNKREEGGDDWISWGFDDAITQFCLSTNITFVPTIEDPEEFRLT